MKHTIVREMLLQVIKDIGVDASQISEEKIKAAVLLMANRINSQNDGKPGKPADMRNKRRNPSLSDIE